VDHQRVALLGQLSESDVVHDGKDLWTYSSADNAVTHRTLPPERQGDAADAEAGDVPLTPADAADKALTAIDPSTVVTVDSTQEIAGRSAYTLSLRPRDARSTVRQVLVAVDAETSVPLRVQVFGAAVKPAFETAFTDISFARPAAAAFTFSPPRGAVVTEKDLTGRLADDSTDEPDTAASAPTTSVIGAGWTSVLAVAAPSGAVTGSSAVTGSVLDQLTRTLPNGDLLLTTSLVNALLAKDGRVFVGAVAPELLQKAAGAAG
jgi:outer membrane lipoprotein-sorting protein